MQESADKLQAQCYKILAAVTKDRTGQSAM